MHPNDGRVVSNFIIQALKGEDITGVCVKNVRGVARNIFLRYNLLVCELSDKEEAL